ncbi:Hypothetical predicted protein [Paramuricea clavata]|uniref:Uncharacterized protein n=1 Tax=Paramuricea clavata TaxID=317549 RepID=A0A7D9IIC5_PARCT|nr:Hypothetical predicted protein [Paramuricea clavata]
MLNRSTEEADAEDNQERNLHGVDWDVADVSSADSVEVPEVPAPTLQNGLQELNEVIDPLKESDCHDSWKCYGVEAVLEKGIGRSSVANLTTSRQLSVGNTSTPARKLIRSLRSTPAGICVTM